MTTLCAWCRDDRAARGLPPVVIRQDDQPPLDQVSHGMCGLCAAAALGVPPALLEVREADDDAGARSRPPAEGPRSVTDCWPTE